MKNILGSKGANLSEMTNLGIPVPPGFIISTQACTEYYTNNTFPDGLADEITHNLQLLENTVNKRLASQNPLLLSVRSGAPVSMPGMMDTVLNLGLNDDTVKALADVTGNERLAYDCYRRFLDMFADVVLGIGHENFEAILERHRTRRRPPQKTNHTLQKHNCQKDRTRIPKRPRSPAKHGNTGNLSLMEQ